MTRPALQSALIVEVPEAEPAVARHRDRFDASQFDDVIPHLTVGHGQPLDDLRAAEESIQTHLPIDAHATAVTLITQQAGGGRWIRNAAFSLT